MKLKYKNKIYELEGYYFYGQYLAEILKMNSTTSLLTAYE